MTDLIEFVVSFTFCAYFGIYNGINLLLLALAFVDVRKRLQLKGLEDYEVLENSPYTPPVSILVPAYNEAVTIEASLKSLCALRFPAFEIIVVNDGSKDRTMEVLKRVLKLRRARLPVPRRQSPPRRVCAVSTSDHSAAASVTRLVVVDKANGGKADALNAGINASACPYVISMDADSLIDEVALSQIFRLLLERKEVAAVGGQVVVANGCTIADGHVLKVGLPKSHLARFQIIEILAQLHDGAHGAVALNGLLIISGVFCIFEKEADSRRRLY